jgi:hypothetical protein
VSWSAGPDTPDQYGVVGHPVTHSWSPFIHGMFARATAQNLVYRLFDIPPDDFRREALRLFAGGVRGLNITLPHKQAAAELGPMSREQLAEIHLRPGRSEDAGEMIDPQSKAEYGRRLAALREEIEEAREFGDETRIAIAEDEIDALHRELSRALGRTNRSRRANSVTERSRLSVRRAIKVALEQVTAKHPALARHLNSTIKTGLYCSYRPDPRRPPAWRF